jgi:cytidine deaminase
MTPVGQFETYLNNFPASVHKYLETIPQNCGRLAADPCRAVQDALKLSMNDLMLRLLPLACLYSRTDISGFQVGAVVKAELSDKNDETALFLGANIEFPGQALSQTIHAEQAAVVNAWLQGARQIEMIAVSEAPCGCCRQFLYELDGSPYLKVLLQELPREKPAMFELPELLPQAFGPYDLGAESGLTAPPARLPNLKLRSSSEDKLVLNALSAACNSYAPYSQNLAGCAIQTGDEQIYAGPYAENVAFNPSLSPLHTAIVCMMMDNLGTDSKITRAVLVENPASISQRAVCEQLLETVAPDVDLAYFEAG